MKKSKLMFVLLVTLYALSFLSVAAMAQTSRGSIAGNILDSSGAAVAGAQINAKNTQTGATAQTTSGNAGNYIFPQLAAGSYDVTVNRQGFKAAVISGVVVQVNTTTTTDVKLELGDVSETVTVSGDNPTVESETSDIGTVVSTRQVLDLPLVQGGVGAMRSAENFVFLTPGAIGPGTAGGAGGVFESKVSGGQNYGTEILLDGADTQRSENGSSFDETAPSVDAYQEFKVLTSTLPADYGRTSGGIESFGIKSGTNTYHGEAFDLFKNTDLDANRWFNNGRIGRNSSDGVNRYTNRRPLDNSNDFGGTFGGPVRIPKLYNGRDRTFFFFAWEQFRRNQGNLSNSTVPLAAFKNGDFSSLLGAPTGQINPCTGQPILQGQIFDPATTQTVGGKQCRLPFAGNIIPTNRFSAVANKLLPFFPNPQNGNTRNNFNFQSSFPVVNTATTVKVDQNIGANDKISASYNSRDNTRRTDTPSLPEPIANNAQFQDFFTHYVRIAEDHTFSPTVLNHLNFGYNRTNSFNQAAAAKKGVNYAQQLGIQGLPAVSPLFPHFNFNGPAGITSIGFGVNNDTLDNGIRATDIVSWSRGEHNFRFGGEYHHQEFSPGSHNDTAGNFTFSTGETAAGPSFGATTGEGFASFLLGSVNNAFLAYVPNQLRWNSNYFAFFGQDDWKVRKNLTVNLGLRWDVDQPRREAHDRSSELSLTTPNPGAGGYPGALVFAGSGPGHVGSSQFLTAFKKDFAPRLGFAYSPSRDSGMLGRLLGQDRTVIRGGYGIYYEPLIYADFGNRLQRGYNSNPGFNSPDQGFSPAFNIDQGVPNFAKPPFFDPTLANGQDPDYLAPGYQRPGMTQNWSLEVQHELAKDLILDVAYVGTKGNRLRSSLARLDSANPTPQYLALGGLLNSSFGNPSQAAQLAAAGFRPPYAGFTGSLAQSLRPFPQYNTINTDCCLENLGQSSFNALEAKLQRRFRNGLNLLASYTFSKTLTDADSALPVFAQFAGGGAIQNPYNRRGEKSLSNQDIPHIFVVSYIYELPVGRGKKILGNSGKAANAVIGGWEISGVQRYQSGQPVSFCCASGIPGVEGAIRPDRVSGQPLASAAYKNGRFNPFDPNPANQTQLNPNAFFDQNASGTVFSFGTTPRTTGEFRTPHYLSEDFSLIKNTYVTEGTYVQFKVDALNAFNRHIFNRPDTGFGGSPLTNSHYGHVDDTINDPRKLQLELKLVF